MAIFFIIVIIFSAILNMIADIFLVSGKDYKTSKQSTVDIINKTKDKHIYLSAKLGVIAIPMWMSVIYFLSYIKSNIGTILIIIYAMYIATITVFHVMCSNVFLLYKYSNKGEQKLKKLLIYYAIPCVVLSTAYSSIMLYLGINSTLHLNVLHYLTLPICSSLLIQVILGNTIKIKHFDSISGTVSMLVTMLSTVHIIISNFNIIL